MKGGKPTLPKSISSKRLGLERFNSTAQNLGLQPEASSSLLTLKEPSQPQQTQGREAHQPNKAASVVGEKNVRPFLNAAANDHSLLSRTSLGQNQLISEQPSIRSQK